MNKKSLWILTVLVLASMHLAEAQPAESLPDRHAGQWQLFHSQIHRR